MIGLDQLMSPALGMTIAFLSTPWLAKLGVRGVASWVERDVADELRRVQPLWWAATGALAFAMALSLEYRIQSASSGAIFATAMVGLNAALLIQLARIDARCKLLPDALTLGLFASGLVFHVFLAPGNLVDAIIGAALGYGLMWGLAITFQKLRGMEAMGRGDFAMTAGIGAWLGWQGLPFALVLSCLFALAFAVCRNILASKSSLQRRAFLSQELAFGPALSAGAACAWIVLG